MNGETPKEQQKNSRIQWTATGVAVIAAIAALLGAILTGVANSKSATAASEAARTAKQAVTNQDLTTLITSLVAASQKTQELERTLQARHDLERQKGVQAADAPIEAALEALREGAINLGLTVDSLITSVGDAEVRQCVEAIRAATSLIVLKASDKGPGSPARPYSRVNSRAIANKGQDPGVNLDTQITELNSDSRAAIAALGAMKAPVPPATFDLRGCLSMKFESS